MSNRVEKGEKTGARKRFTRYANYVSVFITSLFIYLLEILLDIPVYNIEIWIFINQLLLIPKFKIIIQTRLEPDYI